MYMIHVDATAYSNRDNAFVIDSLYQAPNEHLYTMYIRMYTCTCVYLGLLRGNSPFLRQQNLQCV